MAGFGDSDDYSIYSQPMTRDSSRADSDPLPTPVDETPSGRPVKAGLQGPRGMNTRQNSANTRSSTPGFSRQYSTPLEMVRESSHYTSEDTQVRNLAGTKDVTINTLQHHRSTKLLISRYESMTPVAPTITHVSSRVPKRSDQLPPPTSLKKGKGNSPIRRSLRNFLSVFKKGKHATKYDDPGALSTPYIPETSSFSSANANHASTLYNMFVPDFSTSLTRINLDAPESAPPSSASLRSGPLLYLSQPDESSPMLPVWTTCTVSLQSDRVIITWLSNQGNPSTHTISLSACVDVRSMTLGEMGSNERDLLPEQGEGAQLKVFELQFEAKPREKFAATSVQERAGWVGAIWDAILQSQEKKGAHAPEVRPAVINLSSPVASESECSARSILSALGTPSTLTTPSRPRDERSLPPTPHPFTPSTNVRTYKRISLHDSPRQPAQPIATPLSLTSPRDSFSGGLSPSPSARRSKSPSIMNLGSRSVVTQRLAQMERTYSNTSTPETTVPWIARRNTQKTLPEEPLSSPASQVSRTAFQEPSHLERKGSIVQSEGWRSVYNGEDSTPSKPSASRMSDQQPLASPYSPGASATGSHLTDVSVHRVKSVKNHFKSVPIEVTIQNPVEDHSACVGNNVFGALEVIGEGIDGVQAQNQDAGKELKGIREKLEDIGQGLGRTAKADSDIVQTLHGMRAQLNAGLPAILKQLEGVQVEVRKGAVARAVPTRMNNIKPASFDGLPNTPDLDNTGSISHLAEIHTKLDGLMHLSKGGRSPMAGKEQIAPAAGAEELVKELRSVLALLRKDEGLRESQAEQQADSVRYLNELNSWLEAFVNNGTSQIQAVASGVERLREELGCGSEMRNIPGHRYTDQSDGLLANIRQLLAQNRDREQDAQGLRVAVDGLVGVVQEDLRQKGAAQLTTDAVADLIEKQRQDQQHMLRDLAIELSNDIRGERLHFVDAMKEATEINVQAHVEQFKKELTREVMAMTQEVGRLHRERQGMEQQIADLFAFYSKQKQAGAPIPQRGHSQPGAPSAAPLHSRSASSRRPLPSPSRGR